MLLLLALLACDGDKGSDGGLDSATGADGAGVDGGGADGGGADGGGADGGGADGGSEGDDTGTWSGPTVVLEGSVSCEPCSGPIELLVAGVAPGADLVQRSVEVGAFSVSVPQALGEVVLVAWGDDDGDGQQDAGEPVGGLVDSLSLAEGDVSGVELSVLASRFDPTAAWWGVQLDSGFWVIPGALDILVEPGTTSDDVSAMAAAAGATLFDFIDEVDRAWLTLDVDGLSDDEALAQLETAEAALLDDSRVLGVYRELPSPDLIRTRTRADDDYLGQPADRQVAHLAGRVDQAHDIYDDCVHHFDSADYTRTAKIGLVDADLDALASTTELTHYWTPDRQVVTAGDGLQAAVADSYHGSAVGSILGGKVNGVSTNGWLGGFEGTWKDRTGTEHPYSAVGGLYPWNVAYNGYGTAGKAVYGLYKAVTYDHAQVVNSSMGHGLANMSSRDWIAHMQKLRQAFSLDSSTIFVLAAPNVDVNIDAEQDWSSFGHIYDNVLAVSGVNGQTECACGRSDDYDNIAIAGEYHAGYWLSGLRFNGGTSVTLMGQGTNDGTGTSYVAPQVSAAAALALMFDADATGPEIQSRMRQTGKENPGAVGRSGHTLDFARFTVSLLADEIDDETEYLMKITHQVPRTSAGCGMSIELSNHMCIPTKSDLSHIDGVQDAKDATYSFSSARLVSSAGGDFDLVVDGPGLSPLGFSDHQTTYDGTVARPASFAEEDLQVTGTYQGTANSGSCTYDGSFEAVLLRRQGP